jgi:SAM-dependent methyltransferase
MNDSRVPSAEAIRERLLPLDFFERYAHGSREGEVYVHAHARRFLETLQRLAHLPAGTRVLELGAVPYYMTVLLQTSLGFEVETLSFYEVDRAAAAVHQIQNTKTGERFAFVHRPINVERDLFPFADDAFDLVLCCEILEHLLINPGHMFYEAHRVLKPGGSLLVTTPNVARWQNVMALAAGANIYDRYHGNGIYGRHNREWTLAEVVEGLGACGYTIERAETCDVYPPVFAPGQRPDVAGREDNIFVLARTSGPRRLACPDSLYVLMDEYRNVLWPHIQMGINDVGHLGRGWYGVEWDGDRGCRWTSERAELSLRRHGGSVLEIDVCAHHPDLASSPVTLVIASEGREVGRVVFETYGWMTFALPVREPADGTWTFELTPSRTWSPADHGEPDPRHLGVRVSAARVR